MILKLHTVYLFPCAISDSNSMTAHENATLDEISQETSKDVTAIVEGPILRI